ncbi:lipoprotein-like protein [Paenibacillus larvae subsp. larvae DSM 25430]|nr:lipoprotein-like protein [Paenibacillus larvae subsp. larvae DSM 25430]
MNIKAINSHEKNKYGIIYMKKFLEYAVSLIHSMFIGRRMTTILGQNRAAFMNGRHLTRIIRLIVYYCSVIGLLSSCAGSKDTLHRGMPEKAAGKEPVSILVKSLGFTFPEGLSENQNPYLEYIEDHTNLKVDVRILPSTGYEKALDNIISSDNTPDMINAASEIWIANQVKEQRLKPLDEWIDRYGPDLKKHIPGFVWNKVRIDGKIYGIPSQNLIKGLELMYVRKDWLDRLGLEPPVTIEEYEKVIEAFATQDPNGSGEQDTYGLSMMHSLYRSAPFFGAFGIQLNQWTERDGKLVYSNTLPEMKEALAFFAKLYKNKWLDPDFPMNNNSAFAQKIEEGKIGLFSATWYDTRGPIAKNIEKEPHAEWIPLEYPTGKKGQKGVYATVPVQSYQVIPANSKHGEAVIRMLNFIAGEGRHTLIFGFENEVWKRLNGEIVTDFKEHDKHLYREMFTSLVQVADPLLKTRLHSYGKHFRLYENLQIIEQNLIENLYTGPPTPSMESNMSVLNSLQGVFTKIIVGAVPLDEFDRYVEEWKEKGGDAITREVNEWYQGLNK